MPEPHSRAEFVTVDRAAKIIDLSLPMLRHLVAEGRVSTRQGADGRLRLAMDDLRDVGNTLDMAAYHALAAQAAADGPLTEPWLAEQQYIERAWTGHTTRGIWTGERAKWERMGRTVRLPSAGR